MKKVKVLFFIYQLGAGGAARTLLNVLNHIDQDKFEPVLVTLNYDGSYEQYLHDDITLIKLPTKRLRSAIIPFAKLIRKEKADIVFSTIPNYSIIAISARLLSFSKAKSIVREAAYLDDRTTSRMLLRFYGFVYRFAKKVIALSAGVKDNLINRYNVPAHKINVIYNPVDIDNIKQMANQNDMPAEHNNLFKKNIKTIVTAGRLVPEKDHKTLLTAFSQVTQQMESQLIILGEGELEAALKAQARDLNIADHVHFIGFQDNPYAYFKRADLFALSSLTEGFGHVLVEALAVGTPVVSTNCKPGAPEVLEDGKYGFLCNVGDPDDMAEKMSRALTQTATEKSETVEQGYARANTFAATNIVKQYENTFSDTLNDKRR